MCDDTTYSASGPYFQISSSTATPYWIDEDRIIISNDPLEWKPTPPHYNEILKWTNFHKSRQFNLTMQSKIRTKWLKRSKNSFV